MNFIGSLGILMEMMTSAFVETEKMLTRKKFPMNVRALRFVFVELLRDFVGDMVCREDLDQFLKEVA